MISIICDSAYSWRTISYVTEYIDEDAAFFVFIIKSLLSSGGGGIWAKNVVDTTTYLSKVILIYTTTCLYYDKSLIYQKSYNMYVMLQVFVV